MNFEEVFGVNGKVALVTGGGRGIGAGDPETMKTIAYNNFVYPAITRLPSSKSARSRSNEL